MKKITAFAIMMIALFTVNNLFAQNLTVNFSASDLSVCQGTTVTFHNQSNMSQGSGHILCSWNFGTGSPTNSYVKDSIEVQFYQPGSWQVNLQLTDSVNNAVWGNHSMIIEVLPSPQVSIFTSNYQIDCHHPTVLLLADATFTSSYTWYDANQQPIGSDDTLVVTAAGVYKLIATTMNGCSSTFPNLWIYEHAAPTVSIIGNGMNNGGDTILVCDNQLQYFNFYTTCTTFPNNSTFSFNWNTNETTTYINPQSDGMYSVTLTDGDGCTATDSAYLQTSQLPPSVLVLGQLQVCQGDSTTIAAASGYSYLWSTGDTNASITVPGGYYSVGISNEYGCSVNANQIVMTDYVTAPEVVAQGCYLGASINGAITNPTFQWFQQGFPIPGATMQFYTATTTGSGFYYATVSDGLCNSPNSQFLFVDCTASGIVPITSLSEMKITQGGNELFIELPETGNYEVRLINIIGAQVANLEGRGNLTFNTANLSAGTYVVIATGKEGKASIKKIQVL